MNTLKLEIPNRFGQSLSANLDLPDSGSPHTFGIFAHCFTCSKDLRASREISRGLVESGCGILRFDFTGLGHSTGEFADTNFGSNVSDLIDVSEYLTQNYAAPSILIGHSLGGAAVLQAARHIESGKAIVTIGSPADPAHIEHLLTEKKDEIEGKGEANVILAGREFTIKKQFLDDLRDNKLEREIETSGQAILIMHAPGDQVVGIENAQRLYHAAMHPKSFISLDGADHLLTQRDDSRYAAGVIAAWAVKYLSKDTQATKESGEEEQGVVRVSNSGPKYTTRVKSAGHSFLIDEPLSLGGDDIGATPYGHLLAALGACTAITLRMYANRKEWNIGSIDVELSHSKVHAKDCQDCESKEGQINLMTRSIRFSGTLDDKQKERMLYIAGRCPVHRTLEGQIEVKTALNE